MSIYVPQYKEPMPVYRDTHIPRPKYLTITGNISSFRYCPVMEQLRIELSITGSKYEYWSRRPFTIKRFLSWYSLDVGLVRIGTRVSIDIIKTLEIVGFR